MATEDRMQPWMNRWFMGTNIWPEREAIYARLRELNNKKKAKRQCRGPGQ